jgi:hypothetical protein
MVYFKKNKLQIYYLMLNLNNYSISFNIFPLVDNII